ncbi:hypothetical protein HZ326_25002 [Fusarium oxysporum f. sp. albedinis]|nr:hypothetical protein HZ326_25002 [Fusarium oxysporum f. sp. albedinis]
MSLCVPVGFQALQEGITLLLGGRLASTQSMMVPVINGPSRLLWSMLDADWQLSSRRFVADDDGREKRRDDGGGEKEGKKRRWLVQFCG